MEIDLGDAAVPDLPQPALDLLLEWLALPDGDGWELFNGRLVGRAMATLDHGDAVGGIWEQIGRLRGPPPAGGGWWLSENVKMFLSGQRLQPDLCGWRIEKHPRPPGKVNVDKHQGVCTTPPDWVCEVLSPSTSHGDRGVKRNAYHAAGIAHYWLINLASQDIAVLSRTATGYELVAQAGRDDTVVLPPFEPIEFAVSRVFVIAAARQESLPSSA